MSNRPSIPGLQHLNIIQYFSTPSGFSFDNVLSNRFEIRQEIFQRICNYKFDFQIDGGGQLETEEMS